MSIYANEHSLDCSWWHDWSMCDCPYNYGRYRHAPEHCVVYLEGGDLCPDCDPKGCRGVIQNTFIACGEMGQYCSEKCLKKATGKV